MTRTLGVMILAAGLAGAQVAAPPKTAPAKKTPGPRMAAGAAIPSYKELKYPPLKAVQIPEVAAFTLPNGMKLYLLENHELPLVNGTALVRTGNLFDPPDEIGLATMTGMVMRTGGTKTKTGDQLDEQLENVAASVESSIGETTGSVSFFTLKENVDEVLGTFKDVLTSPEFRPDKLELAKNQLRASIARRNDNPHGIAAREFRDIVYGRDNPYGWQMEYEHVDRVQRDDLAGFYRRYFFPANIMLSVYGDFNTQEMRAKLEKLFADWTVKQPPVPPFPPVPGKAAPGTYLAVKQDVNQTFFHLGHLGGVLKDPNYPALEVMADILGGGFSSRLFKRVRTQLGYAYGIGANWGAEYNHPGVFQVSGSTKSQSTVDTIQVAKEELEKIRTAEVTDEELRTARDTVLNGFVFNFDTPLKTLSRLVRYEYYGYPKDFIFQYQKGVEAVTKADVLRVAKQYLKPEQFAVVAVGKPDEFGKPLTALGPVKPIDLTIPEPKKERAKADAASLARGRELLQQAQKAVGGAEKLAAVKDFTQVAEVSLAMGGGMKGKRTNRWVAPSHFRQDLELPVGRMGSYYDGKSGWMATPQGSGPLPDPVRKQVEMEVFRLPFRLLLSDREAGRTVNYTGSGVLEITDQQGNSVRLEVDEKTGLPRKQIYQSAAMGGPAQVEETYEAWTEVDGIKLPQKITVTRGGQKYSEATVGEVKLNTGLKAEELAQKP